MKKKNFKSLKLNKKSVSNFTNLNGGNNTDDTTDLIRSVIKTNCPSDQTCITDCFGCTWLYC